jgi:hypothetical protein
MPCSPQGHGRAPITRRYFTRPFSIPVIPSYTFCTKKEPVFSSDAACDSATLSLTGANWYKERSGYDPLISWWAEKPYLELIEVLNAYIKTLREDIVERKMVRFLPLQTSHWVATLS